MKSLYKYLFSATLVTIAAGMTSSCEDFLDCEPQSSLSPEVYFTDASQLQAYADECYSRVLPSYKYGFYGSDDRYTDDAVLPTAPDFYYEGQWKVPHTSDDWSFETIYRLNYFLSNVMPKYGEDLSGSKNTITGTVADIKHYIGEMYTLRALEFFNRYQKFGDFPIITEPLPDNEAVLTAASKRSPRNEVARFIIANLDTAANLLSATDKATTRINRDVTLLIKSRVALYEATWLKYFKGTAFVPNGEGWPGKEKDYNSAYQYPSGSIDSEIAWFLDQAISASKEVAEKYKGSLTQNTGTLQQDSSDPSNPYYDMFATEDLSSVPEVLLWRQYVEGVSTHGGCIGANEGNWAQGLTRGYVQNFLMADGTPVYTHGTYADGDGYYHGDKTLEDVVANRDTRLSIFIKIPGQKLVLVGTPKRGQVNMTQPVPPLTDGSDEVRATTGYVLHKGGAFDAVHYSDVWKGFTGMLVYRAAEALLNYMEASYEKEGTVNSTAREYWKLLRQRAGVSDDIDATIAATDMNKEAENDWAARSAGKLIDPTLYNIRRERRSEFLSEGLRFMDLHRWRAIDQLISTPYIPEGFHLWNTPMESWYTDLKADGSSTANVSQKSDSEYLRPYRYTSTQRCYDGYKWKMAHYLYPLPVKQMQLTSDDGSTISTSPIYQNPYWKTEADTPAEQ